MPLFLKRLCHIKANTSLKFNFEEPLASPHPAYPSFAKEWT